MDTQPTKNLVDGLTKNGFILPDGYSWNIEKENEIKQGKIVVKNKKGIVHAILFYDHDKLNGICSFYSKGIIKEKITFVNNVAEGWGCEMNKGKETKWFIYKDGEKVYDLVKCEEKQGYWKELLIGTQTVVSICQYDKDHQKNGNCYFYNDNTIQRIELYEHGSKKSNIKLFQDNEMTEYDNEGNIVYGGEYEDSFLHDYPRSGEGMEIKDDECVYTGKWENNMKNGYGNSLQNGFVLYEGEWKDNLPHGEGTLYNTEDSEVIYDGKWENGIFKVSENESYIYLTGESCTNEPDNEDRIKQPIITPNDDKSIRYEIRDNFTYQRKNTDNKEYGIFENDKLVFGRHYIKDNVYYDVGESLQVISSKETMVSIYEDGRLKYSAEMKNGNINGYGIEYKYDENKRVKVYEGQWKDNEKHGEGYIFYSETRFYKVLYENGVIKQYIIDESIKNRLDDKYKKELQELGSQVKLDYVEYFEEKEDSEAFRIFCGYIDISTQDYICGIFYNTTSIENTEQYEGMLKNGKYEGRGTFYSNSFLYFEGTFIAGKPIQGSIIYDKHVLYTGTVNEDYEMDGFGTLYYSCDQNTNRENLPVKYQGEFKKNQCDGFGRMYYKGKDCQGHLQYCGYFKENVFEGRGVYFQYSGQSVSCIIGVRTIAKDIYQRLSVIKKEEFDKDMNIMDCWKNSDLANEVNIYSSGIIYSMRKDEKGIWNISFTDKRGVNYSGPVKEMENGAIDVGLMKVGFDGMVYRTLGNQKDDAFYKDSKQDGVVHMGMGSRRFEGYCINYIPNGKGTYFENDEILLSGIWKDNQLSSGKYYFNRQSYSLYDYYEGSFTPPLQFPVKFPVNVTGHGCMYKFNNDQHILLYEGDFAQSMFCGHGKSYEGTLRPCNKKEKCMAGSIVKEGVFEKNQFISGKIRYYDKAKDGFTCFVREDIIIDRVVYILEYYENEQTMKREYCSYTYKDKQDRMIGVFVSGCYLIDGIKMNGKWIEKLTYYEYTSGEIEQLLKNKQMRPIDFCRDDHRRLTRHLNEEGKFTGVVIYYLENSMTIEYNNGMGKIIQGRTVIYEGGMKEVDENGKYRCYKEGKGKYYSKDCCFIGTWLNDCLDGECEVVYSKEETKYCVYQHGECLYITKWIKKSYCYVFDYTNNSIIIYQKDQPIYQGGYVENKGGDKEFKQLIFIPHGHGITFENNVQRYEGNFNYGRFSGTGRSFDEQGKLVYDGSWRDDKKDGKGIEYVQGKKVYHGEWRDGKRDGQGIEYVQDKMVYNGSWKDGKRDGQGTGYLDNDKIYTGEWKNGVMNGEGNVKWGKNKMTGRFKNNNVDSEVYVYYENILVYCGLIKDDKPYKGYFYVSIGNNYFISEKTKGIPSRTDITLKTEKRTDYYTGGYEYDEETWTLRLKGKGILYWHGYLYDGVFIDNSTITQCLVKDNRDNLVFCGEVKNMELYAGFIANEHDSYDEGMLKNNKVVSGYVVEKKKRWMNPTYEYYVKEVDSKTYEGLYKENQWSYRKLMKDSPFVDFYPKDSTPSIRPPKRTLQGPSSKPSSNIMIEGLTVSDNEPSNHNQDQTRKKPSSNIMIEGLTVNDNHPNKNSVFSGGNTIHRQVRDDTSINLQPPGNLGNLFILSRSKPVGHSTPKKQEKKYSERIFKVNNKYYDENGEITVDLEGDYVIVHDKTNHCICYMYKKEDDHTYRYDKTTIREH